MTALCGGGTSSPKPGHAAVVDYTTSLLANILAGRGAKWLIPVLPLVSLPPLALSTFCASDPPTLPSFTTDETEALLGLNFGADFSSGLAKFSDFLLRVIWYEVCQCDSGSATAYVAPTIPSGTPITQTPGTAIGDIPCYTRASASTISSGGPYEYDAWLWHGSPSNLQFVRLEMHQPKPTTGTLIPVHWQMYLTNNSAITLIKTVECPALFDFTIDIPLEPGVTEFRMQGTAGYNTTDKSSWVISGYCGDIGANDNGACAADLATNAMLEAILKMVTLQQRQTAPFAYVYGDNHTDLEGDGEIAVSGLLGVSIDVTALPSTVGTSAGTPQHLFDVGYVTMGTADGWERSRRIDADGTLSFAPPGVGAITRIGYTLSPGVTIDLREILREP